MSLLYRADLRTLWLLGCPVEHSMSPLIQNTALEFLGLPLVYLAASVPPQGVEAAVSGLLALGALGANVTVPHKETAFRLCHSVSERARAMGACNVLKFVDGQVLGDNTDGAGWLRGLRERLHDRVPHRALVLGAGGAARAILYSLIQIGVPEIVLFNRTPARAEALAQEMKAPESRLEVASLADWERYLEADCLVVQTTSAGLDGEQSPISLPQHWPERALFSELIYGRDTPLASAVRGLGGEVYSGLPMLVYQAAESLAIWLDRPLEEIPADGMMAAARQRLAGLL